MKLEHLQALACDDCPANVTVQRGQGVAGSVLTVTVTHETTCPWAAVHVPVGGAMLTKPGALLWHVIATDEVPC